MERFSRKRGRKLQAEEHQITDRLVEESADRASLFHQQVPRSRTSFPSTAEGRDGDKIFVVNPTGTWKTEKVRGRWFRTKMGDVTEEDPGEVTAKEVVAKALESLGEDSSTAHVLMLGPEDDIDGNVADVDGGSGVAVSHNYYGGSVQVLWL